MDVYGKLLLGCWRLYCNELKGNLISTWVDTFSYCSSLQPKREVQTSGHIHCHHSSVSTACYRRLVAWSWIFFFIRYQLWLPLDNMMVGRDKRSRELSGEKHWHWRNNCLVLKFWIKQDSKWATFWRPEWDRAIRLRCREMHPYEGYNTKKYRATSYIIISMLFTVIMLFIKLRLFQ